MADYTVTPVFNLIAHQHITHPNSVVGADRTPAVGSIGVNIEMFHGFTEAVANTNPGSFIVQQRLEAADDQWDKVAEFTVSDATPADEALDAQEVAGTVSLAVTLTAGFSPGDEIYITDDTADTASEWHTIDRIVTDTSIELTDGLVNQKEIGDNCFSDAQTIRFHLNLAGVLEYRVLYKAEGAIGANTAIWVRAVEYTDFE